MFKNKISNAIFLCRVSDIIAFSSDKCVEIVIPLNLNWRYYATLNLAYFISSNDLFHQICLLNMHLEGMKALLFTDSIDIFFKCPHTYTRIHRHYFSRSSISVKNCVYVIFHTSQHKIFFIGILFFLDRPFIPFHPIRNPILPHTTQSITTDIEW